MKSKALKKHLERDSGCQLFWKNCFGCHKCMSPHGWIWTICHLVSTYLNLNIQMVVSRFQIGTVAESYYLKSGKFCTWLSISIFLGKHKRCTSSKLKQILRSILSSSVIYNLLNENVNRWIWVWNVEYKNVNHWI